MNDFFRNFSNPKFGYYETIPIYDNKYKNNFVILWLRK